MKNRQKTILFKDACFKYLQRMTSLYRLLVFGLIFFTHCTYGQGSNIGQFAIWKAKDGQLQSFEEGYKQHLNWHKTNGDQWGWYGWFFISGPRYGQFADATFDHSWSDFDKAVKPSDDMADNKLHVFPFADVQAIFKVAGVPGASSNNEMKARLARWVTLTTDDPEQAVKVSEKLKDYYTSKQIRFFKTYQVIDGGDTSQVILMLGFDNWGEYAISEDLNRKVAEFEKSLKIKAIRSVVSETMIYRADLSFFPN